MHSDQELNYLTKSLQHHPSPYIIYELDGSIAWANIAAKYIFNLDTLEELSVIKIDEKIGAIFNSHIDGKKIILSPEKSIQIQKTLNSDIVMVLDECPKLSLDKKKIAKLNKELFLDPSPNPSSASLLRHGGPSGKISTTSAFFTIMFSISVRVCTHSSYIE